MFTRFGYAVILTIMAGAIAAVAIVMWPAISDSLDDDADGGNGTAVTEATATPDAELPEMAIERVIDFIRYGAVALITAEGEQLTVTFREDWTPGPELPQTRVFRSSVAEGQNVTDVLRAAGIEVNAPGGVEVVFR